ncbi:hypothetical protein VTO42DRAFT_8308 [Malbranchea cinnamomea]
MAEVDNVDTTAPVKPGFGPSWIPDPNFVPVWARSPVQYAQNLLECSDEPIEYNHDDEDYRDNCFFFPEDCIYPPPKNWVSNPDASVAESELESIDDMTPTLPNIKMLDVAALTDLISDNLSPPEITSIIIFATNGAIFAHASPLPQRQLRNLTAVYGAAYTSYAVTSPNGNLTGVNPASHPSSFVTAPSVPLGDVGSIIFELEDQGLVAVVTKIADKVLLAVVGPTHIDSRAGGTNGGSTKTVIWTSAASDTERATTTAPDSLASTLDQPGLDPSAKFASSAPNPGTLPTSGQGGASSSSNRQDDADESLRTQWEIDRKSDLDRLASLNLNSSPSILLALESKSAALGRFLSNKLADLECPEDF